MKVPEYEHVTRYNLGTTPGGCMGRCVSQARENEVLYSDYRMLQTYFQNHPQPKGKNGKFSSQRGISFRDLASAWGLSRNGLRKKMKKQEADLMKPIPAPGKCGPSKSEDATIIGSLEKAKRWFTGENIFVRCYLDDPRRDDLTEAQ